MPRYVDIGAFWTTGLLARDQTCTFWIRAAMLFDPMVSACTATATPITGVTTMVGETEIFMGSAVSVSRGDSTSAISRSSSRSHNASFADNSYPLSLFKSALKAFSCALNLGYDVSLR